jgi:hypothetical protein
VPGCADGRCCLRDCDSETKSDWSGSGCYVVLARSVTSILVAFAVESRHDESDRTADYAV